MAVNNVNMMNPNLLNTLFGRKTGSRRFTFSNSWSLNTTSWSLDSFSSNTTNQILKLTVEKMQSAINQTSTISRFPTGAIRQGPATELPGTQVEEPQPSRWEIDRALERAGGSEAHSPWLVDGKTKVNVNGRTMVVDVNKTSTKSGGKAPGDTGSDVLTSIARFGLDAQSLEGGADSVRAKLKEAASRLSAEQPGLTLAIEYALEDAFAKVSAWEQGDNNVEAFDYEKQRETNLQQAESVARQLNLDSSMRWGIDSTAEDLAIFGLDLTALSEDPFELADKIKDKSKEMLSALESRYAGTETEFIRERNRITGASARLVNGLQGSAGGLITASMNMTATSTTATVNINGASINANAIIAVGNVIVDPLVLDLNGDGIDLKGADEGVEFDMTGDGQKASMGFVRGDDALLFIDQYGDGVVRDGRQLFGNNDGHANGFEMLRAYDDNGDGVIDENDAIYDQLMLWQEKTEDGVCEREETMTLREAGIKSINLGYDNVREDDGKGNLVGQTGSFTREDGTEGTAVDVWFQELKARP